MEEMAGMLATLTGTAARDAALQGPDHVEGIAVSSPGHFTARCACGCMAGERSRTSSVRSDTSDQLDPTDMNQSLKALI
jgi:hypothetical protein